MKKGLKRVQNNPIHFPLEVVGKIDLMKKGLKQRYSSTVNLRLLAALERLT